MTMRQRLIAAALKANRLTTKTGIDHAVGVMHGYRDMPADEAIIVAPWTRTMERGTWALFDGTIVYTSDDGWLEWWS